MNEAFTVAGEHAAHGLAGVSSGETLVPIIGLLKTDNSTMMQRLAMDPEEAFSIADQHLESPKNDITSTAVIFDIRFTMDGIKTDALQVRIRTGDVQAEILLPYRHAEHAQGFAVNRPKITNLEGIEPEEFGPLMDAFFDGLDKDTVVGNVWSDNYVDQRTPMDSSAPSASIPGVAFSGLPPLDHERFMRLPYLIFMLVAGADGSVDKKELKQLVKTLGNIDALGSPLLATIVTAGADDAIKYVQDIITSETPYQDELTAVSEIIEETLSEEDADSFRMALMQLGVMIANASGGMFGFGGKMSKEEAAALAVIASILKVKLPS